MKFSSWFKILIASFLIFISYRYRIRQYDIIPPVYTTFDEQAYLWAGESLLSTGIPVGWSILDLYFSKNYTLPGNPGISVNGYGIAINDQTRTLSNWHKLKGTIAIDQEIEIDNYKSQFKIVQPFLENPPLYGILLALFNHGSGINPTSVKQIRLVSIVLTSITAAGVFWLGYLTAGLGAGMIAGLIYALSPGMVVSGRLAIPENIIASLLIFSLIALHYYLKKPQRIFIWLLIIIAFISPWLKISGLIIPITIGALLISRKQFRPATYLVLGTILGLLAYFAYGFFYDSAIFIKILQAQTQRQFAGPISMAIKMLFPQIPVPMYEGWILLGYLSVFWLTGKRLNQANFIVMGVIIHTLFFLLYGGNNFPWYQFIAFPLLALAGGILIKHFLFQPKIFFNIFVFVIIFSSLLHYSYLSQDFKWQTILTQYRILIFVLLITPLAAWLFKFKHKFLTRHSLTMILIGSLYLSTQVINHMQELWLILEKLPYPLTWQQ